MGRHAVVGREVGATRVPHIGQVELVHAPLVRVRHVAVLERVPDVLRRQVNRLRITLGMYLIPASPARRESRGSYVRSLALEDFSKR